MFNFHKANASPVVFTLEIIKPGLTVFGRMHRQGTLSITQSMWTETVDAQGDSWIFMNESQQIDHFGSHYFNLL